MHLTARAVVLALAAPAQHSSPPTCVSRRALGQGLLAASSTALLPSRASALFESPAQLALQSLATVQPKVQGLVKEVTEIDRRRTRMAPDSEDDAYVLRFTRAVLKPLPAAMGTAAPALKSERATALTAELEASLENLDLACREKASDRQLGALQAVEKEIGEFLVIAKTAKFDTKAREDINAYSQGADLLYNKWLFRAG